MICGPMHRNSGLAAGLMALPLLLTGCATFTLPTWPDAAPAVQQAVAPRLYHDAIELGGRLSVRYQQNGTEQAIHGSFTWVQNPAHTTVTLLSPLGQTVAMIEITPTASTLTRSGQAPRMAADVDALAAEAFGWPLPVSGLRDWLQGFARAADGSRFAATPQAAQTTQLTTGDGWRLHYTSWQDAAPSMPAHPKRIDLERNTAQAGDVALRIVIDNWQPR